MAWVVSALVGMAIGFLLAKALPPSPRTTRAAPPAVTVLERLPDGTERPIQRPGESGTAESSAFSPPAAPRIPLVVCLPFIALLAGIALFPFINERWWHTHYPDVALLLGGLVVGYYLFGLKTYGCTHTVHALEEYYAFFALVGGLYVAAGGVLVDLRVRPTPAANTAILAVGAVLANIVGTTGASMLLIRPFMRINSDARGSRIRPFHIIFFIFIVSNCGGCLTPIGDPPLYLGYLKGVPFSWTFLHLWPMWLLVNGSLLGIFFAIDTAAARTRPALPSEHAGHRRLRVIGLGGILVLLLIVACVFIDPLFKQWGWSAVAHLPIGATLQLVLAGAAYFLAPRHVHQANHFTFGPVKEVGLLFAGIFATMMPALAYLDQHAPSLGLTSPTQFYFATGLLSAGLDNAPTYLSFLQIAAGVLGLDLNPADLHRLIEDSFVIVQSGGRRVDFVGQVMLEAIALGAVFFGALTYIGNGPNFMVKAIAEGRGLRMPSFFGYAFVAAGALGPVLLLTWIIFIR